MRSNVDICNVALGRIGITKVIESITERSAEALCCNRIFEQTRDKVLEDAPWPFARKTVTLQLTGTAPDRWLYSYQYPSGCVKIRRLYPEFPDGYSKASFRSWLLKQKFPYEIYSGDDGPAVICTDVENATAEYTVKVTDPNRFTAKFASALAWALAAELALPLAKGINYAQNAQTAYETEISQALAAMLNEEQPDDNPESEFVRARY